jgi:hypothetical protein
MIRFSSQTRIKLWHLLLAIAVLGVGLALLPQRAGIPILLVIEGMLIIALLFFLVVAALRKLAKK